MIFSGRYRVQHHTIHVASNRRDDKYLVEGRADEWLGAGGVFMARAVHKPVVRRQKQERHNARRRASEQVLGLWNVLRRRQRRRWRSQCQLVQDGDRGNAPLMAQSYQHAMEFD